MIILDWELEGYRSAPIPPRRIFINDAVLLLLRQQTLPGIHLQKRVRDILFHSMEKREGDSKGHEMGITQLFADVSAGNKSDR